MSAHSARKRPVSFKSWPRGAYSEPSSVFP